MNPTASPSDIASLTSLLPGHYAAYAALVIAVAPLLTRAYYALVNNGGISGVFHAIFYGTNTPKILVAGFFALSLTNCASVMAWAASPLGQATVATAANLGKQLAKAAEQQVVAQIITKATASLAALQAQGVNADTAKEIVRQSEMAGLSAVIEAAQQQYVGMTGARFTLPKNPVPVTP